MLATSGTKPVGKAQEVFLIDVIENRRHRLLDKLVFQGSNPQRTHSPIGLRDVGPLGGPRAIGPPMDPLMEYTQLGLQSDFVLPPRHSVNAGGRLPLEGAEAFPEQVDVDMVQQGSEPHTLIPACHLSRRATSRTRNRPFDTHARLCVRGVAVCRVFPLVSPLPSTSSAEDAATSALFGGFSGTMGLSEFPPTCVPDARPLAFSGRLAAPSAASVDGISRFSCMERLRMRGFSDSAGPARDSR